MTPAVGRVEARKEVREEWDAAVAACKLAREDAVLVERQLVELLGPTGARSLAPALLKLMRKTYLAGFREGAASEALSQWPPPRLMRVLRLTKNRRVHDASA
jgi:hypothetical protein